MLLLLALALAFCPQRLRQPALLSGLLALGAAILAAWTARHYWSPARVRPFFVSLEDFVYAFAVGGLVWLLGTWPLHRRMVLNIRPGTLLPRYFMFSVLAATLTIGASLLESKPMYGCLLPIVGVGLVVFLPPSGAVRGSVGGTCRLRSRALCAPEGILHPYTHFRWSVALCAPLGPEVVGDSIG
jgi:hypothetical protein